MAGARTEEKQANLPISQLSTSASPARTNPQLRKSFGFSTSGGFIPWGSWVRLIKRICARCSGFWKLLPAFDVIAFNPSRVAIHSCHLLPDRRRRGIIDTNTTVL